MKYKYFFFATLLFSALHTGAQQQSRLISQMQLDYDNTAGFTSADSFTYKYSSGRGSDMKTGVYKYDTSVAMYFPGATAKDTTRTIQDFYTDNKLKSIVRQLVNTSGQFVNYQRSSYYYRSNGDMDSVINDTWNGFNNSWAKSSRTKYTYNGAQKLSLYEDQVWDLSQYVTDHRITYTYNGNDLVKTTEELYDAPNTTWIGVAEHRYAYYVGGKVYSDSLQTWDATLPGFTHSRRTLYIYDGAGNTDTVTEQHWDALAVDYNVQYRHAYNYNSNKDITSDSFFVYDSNTDLFGNSNNYYYAYSVPGALISILEEYYTGATFEPFRKSEWDLNSFDQPTRFIAYDWDAAATIFKPRPGSDNQIRYHYQVYDPTSIADATSDNDRLQLYPNPASGSATIAFDNNKAAAISVSIIDMQGRLIKAWEEPATQHLRRTVATDLLTPGNYIIRLRIDNKEMTKLLSIAR